jgi:hypothetical protein
MRATDLLHGHGLEHVVAQRANDANVRGGRELLAHVPSVDRRLEVVYDPVCRQPLHALVCVAGHLELEVPLMISGIDLVCLRILV